MLFFGWEGVGLCSYLLIGYDHDRRAANDAAMKAFVVNRVGDFSFILGLIVLAVLYGSLDMDVLLAERPSLPFVMWGDYRLDGSVSRLWLVVCWCYGKVRTMGLAYLAG